MLIQSQIAATLVMLVAGGIAYYVGIVVAILFETPRVQHTSELSDPEIYTIVMFAGAVLTCIGMVCACKNLAMSHIDTMS